MQPFPQGQASAAPAWVSQSEKNTFLDVLDKRNCCTAGKIWLEYEHSCFFECEPIVSSTLRKGGFAPIRKVRGIFFTQSCYFLA